MWSWYLIQKLASSVADILTIAHSSLERDDREEERGVETRTQWNNTSILGKIIVKKIREENRFREKMPFETECFEYSCLIKNKEKHSTGNGCETWHALSCCACMS